MSNDNKPSNAEGDDPISPEEIHKILSEAAQELEQDANKALKGLEEDKEIMRKLQEIKQKRKESKTDINKGRYCTKKTSTSILASNQSEAIIYFSEGQKF